RSFMDVSCEPLRRWGASHSRRPALVLCWIGGTGLGVSMTSAATRLAAIGLAGLLLTGCATAQKMMGAAPSPCQDTTVTLYFETGQDDVGDIGRQIIKATAQRLKSCPVDELLLLGL